MTFSRVLLFMLLMCVSSNVYAQVVVMGGPDPLGKSEEIIGQEITKKTVRLLAIGISNFKDSRHFQPLKYASSLAGFKKVSEDYLRLSYQNHPTPTFLSSIVNASDVRNAFIDLVNQSQESDVIIISVVSHGEVDGGEYYLVCSDTDYSNYSKTAVSGTEIRSYLEDMANKGAIVLFFLDTCHAEAVFENTSFYPRSNGSIAYFASSKSKETAKEIGQLCRFTETVIDIFQNRIKKAFFNGYATINSLDAQINAALAAVHKDYKQTPVSMYRTNNDHFGDYPILKEKILTPSPSILQDPHPFLPWAVSPNKGKVYDYAFIGVEGVSLMGMVLCGPILQPYYKNKISKETNVFKRNDYRQKGKKASYGFCISTGCLLASYFARTIHVRRQMVNEHKEKQFATLDIQPVLTSDFNGLSLVLNF